MKALVLTDHMKFEYMDVEQPVPADDEVLIRVKAVSVCGSDIAGVDGSTDRRRPPVIMGHEASGVVADVGSGVSRFRAGDRVTFDSTVYCGECEFCRSGQTNLCESRRVLGVSCNEYRSSGAYCEYIAVPERIVYRIPDELSFEAASLAEPVSVGYHAVNLMGIEPGDTVALFGTGTIGLFIVQIVKAVHDAELIVIGRSADKLALAAELGADHVIDSSREDVASRVCEITGGRMPERAVDAAGANETFACAIDILRRGGTFVTMANLKPEFVIDMQALMTKELTVRGCCAFAGEFALSIDLLAQGRIRTDYVISDVLELQDGGDFILKIHENKPKDFFKCILRP